LAGLEIDSPFTEIEIWNGTFIAVELIEVLSFVGTWAASG
jgi:hypothetical protein